jgi:hypothetical protein
MNILVRDGNGTLTTLPVAAPSSAIYDWQVNVNTAATALADQACSSVNIQNDPSSPFSILVGSCTSQHKVLAPGRDITLLVTNTNLIYLKVATGSALANITARS